MPGLLRRRFGTFLCVAGLESFQAPFGGSNLLPEPRGLHEVIVHRVAVIAIGFGAGQTALELGAEVESALLQMFNVIAVTPCLRTVYHIQH